MFAQSLFRASLARLVAGANVVFHCAAYISLMPGEEAQLEAVNVVGTRHLLEASKAAGVTRFVYAGSIEAFGSDPSWDVLDESRAYDPQKALIPYGASKARASLEVLAYAQNGLESVIVCPTSIIGPNDFQQSRMGQMILQFAQKRLPAYPGSGGFDFVDVGDAVDAMIWASHSGMSGESYIVSGQYLSIPKLMTLLEDITGVRKPWLRFPLPCLQFFAAIAERFYQITKRKGILTRDSMRVLDLKVRIDGSKLRREASTQARPIADSIRDTLTFFGVSCR